MSGSPTTSLPTSTPAGSTTLKRQITSVRHNGKRRKRSTKRDEDPELASILTGVKLFVRLVNPFVCFSDMFLYVCHVWNTLTSKESDFNARIALIINLDDDVEIRHPTPSNHDYWEQWLWLKQRYPSLQRRIAEVMNEPKEYSGLVQALDDAATQARADDTSSAKKRCPEFLQDFVKGSDLSPKDKSDRGFHNDLTGTLICPTGMDFLGNEEHTVALRSKAVKPSEAELPRFLWRTADDFKPIPGARKRPIPTFNIDENELWSNAFEGFYLIQSWANIYASATVKPTGKIVGIKGITLDMPEGVTSVSIAWAAAMAYLALSDIEKFSLDPGRDQFSLEKLYNTILRFLDHPISRDEKSRLFRWWNRQFFPNLRHLHLEGASLGVVDGYLTRKTAEMNE